MKMIIAMSLIFLIHCTPSKSKENNGASIHKGKQGFIDLKPIKEKSILINEINFPCISLAGNRLLVRGISLESKKEYILYIYDKDLDLIDEKHFNVGQGPGELGGAPYFWPVGDRFFVPDNTQLRINIFDKNFNFIEFVKVSFPLSSPIFSKDGKYLVFTDPKFGKYGPNSSFNVSIAYFPDLKQNVIYAFPEVNRLQVKREITYGIQGIHYFLKDDLVYLLNKDTYHLVICDIKGKIVKEVHVDYQKIPTTKEMEDTWLRETRDVSKNIRSKFKVKLAEYVQPCAWMVPMEKGFVVIRKKDYNISCQGLVEGDYFDYNLNLLGKVKFPCFNEIFKLRTYIFLNSCIVDRGFIYLLNYEEKENDEIFLLEKWRISE